MNYPDDLNPKKKAKEIPAALTDPIINTPRPVNPEAIARVANLSSQVNYQASIGNPLAVSGKYGMGSMATVNGPALGREMIEGAKRVTERGLVGATKGALIHGAQRLLQMAPVVGDFIVTRSSAAMAAAGGAVASTSGILLTPAELNAGESDYLRRQMSDVISKGMRPLTEEEMLINAAEDRRIKKEREDYDAFCRHSLSLAKSKNVIEKVSSPDDRIRNYFSQRAVR